MLFDGISRKTFKRPTYGVCDVVMCGISCKTKSAPSPQCPISDPPAMEKVQLFFFKAQMKASVQRFCAIGLVSAVSVPFR